MFNSQKINNDPEPYIIDFGLALGMVRSSEDAGSHWDSHDTYYDPRPEYDNNPNPILVQFRETQEEELPYSDTREWLYFLNNPLTNSWSYATEKHVIHARKVLERLVNVYGSH